MIKHQGLERVRFQCKQCNAELKVVRGLLATQEELTRQQQTSSLHAAELSARLVAQEAEAAKLRQMVHLEGIANKRYGEALEELNMEYENERNR